MHVHLPKPLHGWREFFGEVGIIVIGVLIALGAEQLIENWHWSHKSEQALAGIEQELSLDAGVYEERSLVQHCADRRLAQLDGILRAARRTGTLPSIGEIGRPPSRPTLRTGWDQAIASGVLSHINQHRQESLSPLYAEASDYDNHVRDEQRGWATLRMMEAAPGKTSEVILADLSRTVAELRFTSYFNGLIARQELGYIQAERVRPRYDLIFDKPGTRAELLQLVRDRSLCKPLVVDGG